MSGIVTSSRRRRPRPDRRHAAVPRAFTLVELLVVIGIIAILIGILLPTISRARAVANRTACMATQKEFGNALHMFVNERKGWLPKAWFNSAPRAKDALAAANYAALKDPWGFREGQWGWDVVLLSYMKGSKKVFLCASDDSGVLRGVGVTPGDTSDDIPSSYRVNISNQENVFNAVKLSQLKPAAKAILIVEGKPSAYHHIATYEDGSQVALEGRVSKFFRDNIAYKRHPKEMNNYTFADGHSETLTWDETWKPIGPPPKSGQDLILPAHKGITMWRMRYAPQLDFNNVVRQDQWWANTLTPP